MKADLFNVVCWLKEEQCAWININGSSLMIFCCINVNEVCGAENLKLRIIYIYNDYKKAYVYFCACK